MKKKFKDIFSYYEFNKKKKKISDLLFICDHASNNIPKSYKNLGLNKKDIESHIGWDIGAKAITLNLAKKLESSCFLSNFSRLIVDPNRKINDFDLIPKRSFGKKIPLNENISFDERFLRIKKYYDIYHENLKKIIKRKISDGYKLKLISIHSFTKSSENFDRPNEIGLLWNKDISLMLPLKKKLLEKKISVGCNKPYSGFFYNHTLDYQSQENKIKNLSIEIRNDLICDKKGIIKWSNILKEPLKDFQE